MITRAVTSHRLFGMALLADIICSATLCAAVGPARVAHLAGLDRAHRTWTELRRQVTMASEVNAMHAALRPRPAGLTPADIRPDMTYSQMTAILGGPGYRLVRWDTSAVTPGEASDVTYRWPFTDGSDVSATFENGRLVSFMLSSVGEPAKQR
jgi:hypothetical protein